ncbi:MAG: potassium channel family protein [Nitrososphaeraceae archaeon]
MTTVGYGDYYPVTSAGRILAIVVMLSGIGIVITLIGMLSQRRMQRVVSRIKSKTKVQS